MIKRKLAVLVAGVVLSGGVAANGGVYLLAEGGLSWFDDSDVSDYVQREATEWQNSQLSRSASYSVNSQAFGYRVGAGVQLSSNLAIEGFYMDMGEWDYSVTLRDSAPGLTYRGDIEADAASSGFGAHAKLSLPLGESFFVDGYLGGAYMTTEWSEKWSDEVRDVDGILLGSEVLYSGSGSEKGFSPLFGFGFTLRASESVSLFARYTQLVGVDYAEDEDEDVYFVSAGLALNL